MEIQIGTLKKLLIKRLKQIQAMKDRREHEKRIALDTWDAKSYSNFFSITHETLSVEANLQCSVKVDKSNQKLLSQKCVRSSKRTQRSCISRAVGMFSLGA